MKLLAGQVGDGDAAQIIFAGKLWWGLLVKMTLVMRLGRRLLINEPVGLGHQRAKGV
jgi:hypothetical protein